MSDMEKSNQHKSKKGLILGGVLAVLVIGIGLFILVSMMHQPTMLTEAEREQAMTELSEWAEEVRRNTVQLKMAGPEDIYQFISDYEEISGHMLDYDRDIRGAMTTIRDGICRLDVTNHNTNLSGNFRVTLRFEDNGFSDNYYKAAIQTILQVFGMDADDIHNLTDRFVSDDSFRYSFDESYVDRNYHDDIRVSFQSSMKRPSKTSLMSYGKIEITAYHYPARDKAVPAE